MLGAFLVAKACSIQRQVVFDVHVQAPINADMLDSQVAIAVQVDVAANVAVHVITLVIVVHEMVHVISLREPASWSAVLGKGGYCDGKHEQYCNQPANIVFFICCLLEKLMNGKGGSQSCRNL